MIPISSDQYQAFCTVVGAIVTFFCFFVGAIHFSMWMWTGVLKPTLIEVGEKLKKFRDGERVS